MDKSVPNFSVIIPLYNKQNTILRSMSSVLGQACTDFELIVVNDGSTDLSLAYALTIKDKRVKIYSMENSGPGAARNFGAQVATGNILAFLDADDEWLPSYLQSGIDLLRSLQLPVVCQGAMLANARYRCIDSLPSGIYSLSKKAYSVKMLNVILNHIASPCTMMIEKTVFLKHGGFFNKWKCLYGEDAWLMLKILLNERVGVFPEPPRVIFHTESSDLSSNLNGPRPIPPYLLHPEDVLSNCSPQNELLIKKFLYYRAMSLAREYYLHGDYSTGRGLVTKFQLTGTMKMWRIANEGAYFLYFLRNLTKWMK